MALPTRAHVFHLADVVAGHLRGNPCPNCGTRARPDRPLYRKHFGVASVYQCRGCELLFRPTGLQSTAVARWYYSRLYGDQGIATEPTTTDRATALARARAADKDRSPLVEALLPLVPESARHVGVLGASWGYELLCLEHLGVPLYGIEPGEPRREHGKRSFGLELHASVADAAKAGHRGGIVISSHVLEHIPRLTDVLDEVDRELAPVLHLHLTPRVDPLTPRIAVVIGREHPLGVTEAFWMKRAAERGWAIRLASHVPEPAVSLGETLAALARPDVVDVARLASVAIPFRR